MVKNTKFEKRGLLAIFIIIILVISLQIHILIENKSENKSSLILFAPLTPSGPLTITNDNNFTDYSLPGTGSSGDPYRIENLNITTSSTAAISITGTTKHFVIQNCYLDGDEYCIYLDTLASGTAYIFNNTCTETSRDNIYIDNAPITIVEKNKCSKGQIGITLLNSENSEIKNNYVKELVRTFSFTDCIGIKVDNSAGTEISSNNVTVGKVLGDNPEAVTITNSDEVVFSQNNCTTEGEGSFPNPDYIIVENSDNILLDSNSLSHYSSMQALYGFYINSCNNVSMNKNVINGVAGAFMWWMFYLTGTSELIEISYNRIYAVPASQFIEIGDNVVNITIEHNIQQGTDTMPHSPIPDYMSLDNYLNLTFTNNTFDGKEMLYLKNLNNQVFNFSGSTDYSYVYLINSSQTEIKNGGEHIPKLYLYYCFDCKVINCSTSKTILFETNYTDIDSNLIYYLYLLNSNFNYIINNLPSTGQPIPYSFENSNNNTIHSNVIDISHHSSLGIGISLLNSNYAEIYNNTFTFFDNPEMSYLENSIKVKSSDSVNIHSNKFHRGNNSIYVETSSDVLITNNTFQNNYNEAIYLHTSSSDCLIYYNSFFLNNPSGSSQGFDDGTSNIWYNSTTLTGNLWSDWSGTGSYSIDGASSSVDLYPIDTPLQFLETPEDYSYIEGIEGNYLNWTTIDNNPDFYKIFRNNTEIDNGTWISSVPISILIDGLPIGIYNFTILLNDTGGNIIIDEVWITVVENLPPYLVSFTDDYAFVEGIPNQEIYWYIETDDPGTYWIYQDGGEIDTGPLERPGEGLQLHVSLDLLTQGIYNFSILIQDSANNIINDTVWITVEENYDLPPVITSPGNQTFTVGVGYHGWDWYIEDQDLDQFWIYRNGVEVRHGWLIESLLNHGIDLPEGEYNFTLVVSDHLGNIAIDTIWVTIEAIIINEYPHTIMYFVLVPVLVLMYILRKKQGVMKNS